MTHEPVQLVDLLVLHDVEFVRAAYRALLRRDADAAGEHAYVLLMRRGADKLHLLAEMAASAEGRGTGGQVVGLGRAMRKRALERIFFIGPALRRLVGLFRRRPYLDPEAAYRSQIFGMQRDILDTSERVQRELQQLRGQQSGIEAKLRRLAERPIEASFGLLAEPPAVSDDLSEPVALAALLQQRLTRKAAAWGA